MISIYSKRQIKKPLVTICCMTYNHEQFIKDAIESFLMQKTTFPFEIIIYDDASIDNTSRIIKYYANKHQDIIVPIFQKENQYSKGIRPWFTFLFPLAKGKYIALCDGDDYWTDPYKLQKQVNFLEENKEYSICFHPVYFNENGSIIEDYITRNVPETTDILELAKGNFIHTPSVVFRRHWNNLPAWIFQCPIGDYPLHLINAQYGKIKKLPEIMAVYRIHTSNNWVNQDFKKKIGYIHDYLEVMIGNFSIDVNKLLVERYLNVTMGLIMYLFKTGDVGGAISYLKNVAKKYPFLFVIVLIIKIGRKIKEKFKNG